MRKPLSLSVRVGTVLVICGVVPFANGCRSTRSSLSSLPGLAWVAPSDEDAKFGGWSEDDGPTLPPPSSSSTPQLASKSGDTSLPSANRRAVATSAENSDPHAYAQASYPDTGYDAPYKSSASASRSQTASATNASSKSSGYTTGNYDAGAGRMAAAAKNAEPKRGFYSDDYEDEVPAATQTGGRYGDDPQPSSSSSTSSRYASDASYGRYGETDNDGYGRYGDATDSSVSSAADGVADTMSRTAASSSRWADDVADTYGENVADVGRAADHQVESGKSVARNMAGDLQSTLETASAGVRDRFSAGAESLKEKGRSLGREADSLAQRAMSRKSEALEDRAAEGASKVADANRRYEDFSDTADRWQDETRDADDRLGSAVAEGASQAQALSRNYEGSTNDPRSSGDGNSPSSDSRSLKPASKGSNSPVRASQPWRPGSTGRVSSSGEGTAVNPVSYEASDRTTSRFAPSYR